MRIDNLSPVKNHKQQICFEFQSGNLCKAWDRPRLVTTTKTMMNKKKKSLSEDLSRVLQVFCESASPLDGHKSLCIMKTIFA